MELAAQLLTAKVMHQRLLPKRNGFNYRVYYVLLPLAQLATTSALRVNRRGLMSLHEKDYGARDGSAIKPWLERILAEHQIALPQGAQMLMLTMPRILGYGFNPVNFYFILAASGALHCVVSEVHNTFGESHSYIAAHPNGQPITQEDWLEAEKCFHVSPFLPREGSYRFRFATQQHGKFGIWIDYFNADGQLQLITALQGRLQPLTRASLWRAFATHPLITLKTIALIHWQAIKLMRKGIRYIVKPPQLPQRVTRSKPRDLTNL